MELEFCSPRNDSGWMGQAALAEQGVTDGGLGVPNVTVEPTTMSAAMAGAWASTTSKKKPYIASILHGRHGKPRKVVPVETQPNFKLGGSASETGQSWIEWAWAPQNDVDEKMIAGSQRLRRELRHHDNHAHIGIGDQASSVGQHQLGSGRSDSWGLGCSSKNPMGNAASLAHDDDATMDRKAAMGQKQEGTKAADQQYNVNENWTLIRHYKTLGRFGRLGQRSTSREAGGGGQRRRHSRAIWVQASEGADVAHQMGVVERPDTQWKILYEVANEMWELGCAVTAAAIWRRNVERVHPEGKPPNTLREQLGMHNNKVKETYLHAIGLRYTSKYPLTAPSKCKICITQQIKRRWCQSGWTGLDWTRETTVDEAVTRVGFFDEGSRENPVPGGSRSVIVQVGPDVRSSRALWAAATAIGRPMLLIVFI
ncbi:unnamed protein product [Phytophthora fragariaefolia]|uniref:Unnamed protein product n=1 Tax=Phytophthora fragariaefolia TaxID=1490495 RepID=A0A9W6YC04_9STRA|nr:unnamed protein product [Phytophthora fragariaefolia]